RIISVQERKTELLRLSKKYFLQNMFPRRGESAPRLRVHGFTQPWQTRKLGEMVSVQSGKDYKSLNEGDVPVYGTGGYMLSVSEALSYSEDAIGIGRKGTIDKPFVLRAPFWTVDTLFYCVPKENYDLDFVNVVFQNVNWRVLDESTGVPSLSKKIINEVKAKVPSVGEQRQIGMFFSGLDRIISVQERKTELLRQAKKYYLQNMFA
ncbi:MAG: restriction endonuclease subunit S, partial [Bifidobacteriaceae bacterium]|nr:restriction endonuclease subunit S [Bifidobacteriaceae bacterium]